MKTDGGISARRLVARYFELWNGGDLSIAAEILAEDWIDHAHPEVRGPESVRRALETVRAAQPGLRFRIDAMLVDGDHIAVGAALDVGARGPGETAHYHEPFIRINPGHVLCRGLP